MADCLLGFFLLFREGLIEIPSIIREKMFKSVLQDLGNGDDATPATQQMKHKSQLRRANEKNIALNIR